MTKYNLNNLPRELKENIMIDLSIPDLLQTLSTSKNLAGQLSYHFWKKRAKKDFDITLLSYKEYLQKKYKQYVLGNSERESLMKISQQINIAIKNKEIHLFNGLQLQLVILLRKYLKARYNIQGPVKIKKHCNGGRNYITIANQYTQEVPFGSWICNDTHRVHIQNESYYNIYTTKQAQLIGRLSEEIEKNGAIFVVVVAFHKMYTSESNYIWELKK